MILATIRVEGVRAFPKDVKHIPKGIKKAKVRFEYADPLWDDLSKTVVFQAGDVTKDVLNAGEIVNIPPEVVEEVGEILRVGVYGEGIPTLWADLGRIRDATDPSGDESTDPSLPVWAQQQQQIDVLTQQVGDLMENGQPGGPGVPGKPGEDGKDGEDGGYYTPSVSQPDPETVQFDFTPSKPDMPAVAPATVTLPSPDSGGNVDLTGVVKSVNGVKPDANGNVKIEVSGGNANIYAGDTAPTDGSLVWIDTTEDTAEVEIDSTAWISGYRISGTGGLESIADNANNEAVNYAFIPVEPGETYTLYNSADETWASDTVYVGLYSDDTGHSSAYLGRVTGNPFKVTNKTAFILISSANLANDENYLNARLVKDGGTEVTLTSISASYSGGDVEVGTDVSALAGIVVTAHYSDGSSKTVTGYTLSGTIAEGNNVITVSYNGKTTAFTVMGVREETEVTLSSISATYSGGDVEEGTALSDLTGIVVTATYSDGSTATVTDYTLSGEIAEGENTITVSYGGMTTSFAVTGIADSGGETVGIVLNPDLWKPGYFASGGNITASSSNGEMYYDEFIPVTPGETYYFYNTVEDWTTGWNGIMWYKADKTSLGRKSATISGRYVKFTVSEETAFIKISCRNMTLYYETAVLQSYEDFPAPYMPFESTEWSFGYYINDNGNLVSEGANAKGNANTGLVSVEGGATYRFANSNPDWFADHIGIVYYEDILPSMIDKQTYKQTFTSYDFTVPAGAKYIRLSSQNLTEMYTTATLTKIS